jgi:hypothetical protein
MYRQKLHLLSPNLSLTSHLTSHIVYLITSHFETLVYRLPCDIVKNVGTLISSACLLLHLCHTYVGCGLQQRCGKVYSIYVIMPYIQ